MAHNHSLYGLLYFALPRTALVHFLVRRWMAVQKLRTHCCETTFENMVVSVLCLVSPSKGSVNTVDT